jgi:hypothetical protein
MSAWSAKLLLHDALSPFRNWPSPGGNLLSEAMTITYGYIRIVRGKLVVPPPALANGTIDFTEN